MALADKGAVGGNGAPFFDPKNYVNDLALIIEPKSVRRNITRAGSDGPRDEMLAQVTVFRSRSQLDKGEPHEVKLYTITAKKMVRDLDEVLENAKKAGDTAPAVISAIGLWRPADNPKIKVWVLKTPDEDDYEAAAAYYEKREAATQAALDSVPDF